MGGTCCTVRDRGGIAEDTALILPFDRRTGFQKELLKVIDREKLHSEVLEHQSVLDFESYKVIIGLVTSYVGELQVVRNQKTFM